MSNNYGSELVQNGNGLYDLTIRDGVKTIVAVTNVSFDRAVVILEDYFHTKRRESDD